MRLSLQDIDRIPEQNMVVKLVERDVQSIWLKAGQKCFIE